MNLRQQLKFTARWHLSNGKPSPILVALAAIGLIAGLQCVDAAVTKQTERTNAMIAAMQDYATTMDFDQLTRVANSAGMTVTQTLMSWLLSLMMLMVSIGLTVYIITEVRTHKGSFGNLLDGLPLLIRVLWLQILTGVFVFLWSLLLVVPGIIAAYRYRMALYVLLDHPEMTALDCIRTSKQMMSGQKWELFSLDLSFIGWTLGLSFISGTLTYVLASPVTAAILTLPLAAFVEIYTGVNFFLFYEHLRGVDYDTRIPNETPNQI